MGILTLKSVISIIGRRLCQATVFHLTINLIHFKFQSQENFCQRHGEWKWELTKKKLMTSLENHNGAPIQLITDYYTHKRYLYINEVMGLWLMVSLWSKVFYQLGVEGGYKRNDKATANIVTWHSIQYNLVCDIISIVGSVIRMTRAATIKPKHPKSNQNRSDLQKRKLLRPSQYDNLCGKV